MKRNLQKKFLHEIIYNHLDNIKKDIDITVKERHAQILDLIFVYQRVKEFIVKNKANEYAVKNFLDKYLNDIYEIKKNVIYSDLIQKLYNINVFNKVCAINTSFNLVYNRVNDSESYVFSENLTNILLELGDLRLKCKLKYNDDLKDSYCKYFFYNNYHTEYFYDLHIYSYIDKDGNDVPCKFFIIFIRSKGSDGYSLIVANLYDDKENKTQYNLSYCFDLEVDVFKKLNEDLKQSIMKSEINKLVGLAYASEIFIQDQPDLIQKKINEFSSKKSKRDYEKKHYSNEEYNYIDIPYVNVKAYSDKTWHCKSTYGLRWCGEGRKEAKIVFIKGSTKRWKHQLR